MFSTILYKTVKASVGRFPSLAFPDFVSDSGILGARCGGRFGGLSNRGLQSMSYITELTRNFNIFSKSFNIWKKKFRDLRGEKYSADKNPPKRQSFCQEIVFER